jgi:hypothetical protein
MRKFFLAFLLTIEKMNVSYGSFVACAARAGAGMAGRIWLLGDVEGALAPMEKEV